jgi:DNA-binding XRE family transcriptional regulator
MNLTAERLNRGLTRNQAAEQIGIARATLVAAEDGRSIAPSSAKQIADYYGCRVTDIWPVDDPDGDPVEAAA